MSNITVIGAGYVGLVTATCFAEMGHRVTLLEIDAERINTLEKGVLPVHEPGLPELWQRHWQEGRLHLSRDYQMGLADSEFAFIAVGTPSGTNGKPDLKWVRSAAKSIAQAASSPLIVVNKSTVPVGTAEVVTGIIAREKRNSHDFAVVSNPEFLREGWAVFDFLHPDRVVVGSSDEEAAQAVAKLYEPLGCPIIRCDTGTAEMIKYTANAFLATKISFINEIASLCDKLGVDVKEVARVVGMDKRIGPASMGAGLGWGGSCLPKDVRALISMAGSQRVPVPLLHSVVKVNQKQPRLAVAKLKKRLGSLEDKTIGILGLSFKPNSDDMRQASSLSLISILQKEGCLVKAYDPEAMPTAAKLLPTVALCADAYEVAAGSDALVLVTEWDEFKELDMRRVSATMKYPVLIDGRNLYDPAEMIQAGFIYEGMGRRGTKYQRPETASSLSRKKEMQPALK